MKLHETTEVIDALVGRIHPVGETNEDIERLQSLEDIIEIVTEYILRIENVAEMRNDRRASVKKIAERAHRFRTVLTSYED